MTGGLIQIRVDRDDVLESTEGTIESATVGRGKHRVAGHGEQRAHLPCPARLDLIGQRGHRRIAPELGKLPHATAPAIERPAPAEARKDGHRVHGRRGEHHAADLIEMAGDEIEYL